MIGLRSLAFNIAFFAWSAASMIVFLPLLIRPGPLLLAAARLWSRGSLGLLAVLCGLRYQVRGLANLPKGPCILASKHQSAWDTLIFAVLVKGPCFVFKRELMWVVPFGWYIARAGGVAIDRTGGAAALRSMIRAAQQRIRDGRKILIFPEGTRVAPGQRRPYHPGTAALYARLGVPVVPVALNSGLFWGRRSFAKVPGVITIEFLPPIPPGWPRRKFAAELERRIEQASERLCQAPGAPARTGAPAPAGDGVD